MHVVIAPNAFKNCLTATEAATAIEKGLLQSRLDCTCEQFAIGDGGDGTGELLISKCKGQIISAEAHDPFGRIITTGYGLIEEGKTAVIEMANASGLRLLDPEELNPLKASSAGTGEIMKQALDHGVSKMVIAMGGSATVDGGIGILSALGVQFMNKREEEIERVENLVELESVDLSAVDERFARCELIVLCDVDNRLLGSEGAAAVYGPQKGASPEVVKKLDASLARLAAVALQQTGKDMCAVKYGGTAGGAAAGLYAFLNAKLVSGIDYFLHLTRFSEALEKCDLVITGEGSIDDQTLQGKGPFGVAVKAKEKRIRVVGLAGKVARKPSEELHRYFDVLLPIGNEPFDVITGIMLAEDNLIRTAKEIGNLLAMQWCTTPKKSGPVGRCY